MKNDHRRPRLLAVSHEGSQTGAPIVLVTLLEWLRANADVSIHTLLIDDGPMRPRFEAIGTVSAVTDRPGAQTLGFLERGLEYRGNLRARKLPAALRYRAALATLGRFDIVYLNSITTLDLLPYLKGSPRVLAHSHEGPVTIKDWGRTHDPMASRLTPDRWIAVSDDTAEAIRDLPGAGSADVVMHHPFIDVEAARSNRKSPEDLADLRSSLGIPLDAAIVVGSGSVERRKGPDLFLQLACEVRRNRPTGQVPVHFVWVGGDFTGPEWRLLQADIERCDASHLHVTGHVSDPRPYFQLADVFALTSREDPYPLVCLEHAALEVPIVAYTSSGIRTLLTNAGPEAAAGVIPYLDVCSMARRIEALLASPALLRKVGAQLSDSVEAHHQHLSAAPALAADLGLVRRPCNR